MTVTSSRASKIETYRDTDFPLVSAEKKLHAMNAAFEELLNVSRAGAPLVHIASFEWERVQGHAIGLSKNLELPLVVWSQSTGLVSCDQEGVRTPQDESAIDPLEVLLGIHGAEQEGIWLLEDFHPFLEGEHHRLLRWLREISRLPALPRKIVILSTPLPGLPMELRKEVPTIELALPDKSDLKEVLDLVAAAQGVPAESDDALLDAARGLTVMEARLAFGKAAAELNRLDHSAVRLVSREKERIIKQSEVLEYYPTEAQMSDVGGLGQLKEWLDRRGRAFGVGAQEFGLDAPKGVLLLGVQGCGKSLLAKAVAATWQFPLLRLDLGKVFGGIVGQSEGNIRNALQVAQALAPCVLWIDEIEKGLAGMGSSDQTDGGTTARVVGTLLTWMQEKQDPVFVVATANRIDMLPPELLRKGRFDEIFFVDLPTEDVRREILSIHLRKKKREPNDFDLAALARKSVGYSGAELEEAVREGLFDAFADSRDVRTEDIAKALEQTFPLSRTMADQIDQLRRWAKARARLASGAEPEKIPSPDGTAPRLRQETTRNPFIPGGGS